MRALLKELPKNSKVEVINTVPSRYSSFVTSRNDFRGISGLKGIIIPKHKNGLDQSKAFFIFSKQHYI